MIWILVVIALYADGPGVWPGAVSGLLNRSPQFSTRAACTAARKTLWRKRADGYFEVVKATCILVKEAK
jgi:hypothetical protein